MANLAQLEQLFWHAMRSERTQAELDSAFVGNDALSAARRMDIYRNAYWSRQERALVATFPVVRTVVGDERFRRLAAAYLRQHPSQHFAVECVGQHFPEFLARRSELAVCMGDLARLEWARLEVLLAPPSRSLGMDALRGLDFAAARAQLCPTVRVLQLSQVALRAWHDRTPVQAEEDEARLGCLVWRREHQVSQRQLGSLEQSALELLGAGHDFARVCSIFEDPGGAETAALCIGRWFRDGLLCALAAGQGTAQLRPCEGARNDRMPCRR